VTTNDDQVDNITHQQASEHSIIELESETNLTCESIKTDNSTSIDIELENNTPTNQDISIDIEKASMYVQEGESLPKTPTRISRSEANISSSSETSQIDDILKSENIFGKFKKTLRLSSDLIKALNLRPGSNEVQFSVTTAYQGTTKCRCHLYLWKSTDKIVISDIDGTITKSDVLGHILPIIGKDWAQSGVASLFTKIVNNGYHIAYLSARSIGHAAVTKDYLKSVNQGDMILPDGPLLLNPTSLVSALHREVIIKKPEEFKIACLRDIQKLFPENPFYCGYGNRTNDVFAYRAVGIPISRIFTINSRGELRHELTQTFQTSSYYEQSQEVNRLFPLMSSIRNLAKKTFPKL
jgi:phosphatidate phosphatase LPIN